LQYSVGARTYDSLYCNVQWMLGLTFIVHSILLLDAIVVAKFLLIFCVQGHIRCIQTRNRFNADKLGTD
jgi:hypothetical protein